MKSMTGYGKANHVDENFEMEVEVKSVNSRFFDFKIRSPRELSFMEFRIKDICSQSIKRGKVEVYVNFQDKRVPEIVLDESRFSAFVEVYHRAQSLMGGNRELPFAKIISEPGVILMSNTDLETSGAIETLEKVVAEAVQKHQQMALNEGDSMKTYLTDAMERIASALSEIESAIPSHKEALFEKVKNSIEALLPEALGKEDHKRLMMEAAIYIDKSDVTEEIVRLKNHVQKFLDRVGKSDKEMGKSLNFILQEMHREINTTGSKFGDTGVFPSIMMIREEIEKCRELVQNAE